MGVSGAVLFVPLFTIIFPLVGYPLQPVQAVQLGLFIELFGFASSTTAFWRRGLIDFKIAGFALLFAVPLAIVGGVLANRVPGTWLLVLIGAALMSFSYALLRQTTAELDENGPAKKGREKETKTPWRVHRDRQGRSYRYLDSNDVRRAVIVGVGGVFQGLVGFCAGEFSTVDQVLRRVPVRIASGSAHLIIAGASLAAAGTHLTLVLQEKASIPWPILLASIPGVLIGGQLAGFIAGRLPQDILQMVMARFLLFIGAISWYRAALGMGVRLPIWLLPLALGLFLLSIALYLRRRLAAPLPLKARVVSAGACCGGGQGEKCSTGAPQDETGLDPAQEGSGALVDFQIPARSGSAKESDER